MTDFAVLPTLFGYQAWANREFLQKLEGLHPEQHAAERNTALRLLNHSHVVGQIFAAHLLGKPHAFASDNTVETPTLSTLREAVPALDRWYLDYVTTATPDMLTESLPFVFTDGDKGYMSRLEMLMHVVTHAIYHRGEVGRIMTHLSIPLPWDTFAVHLHTTQPARRRQAS